MEMETRSDGFLSTEREGNGEGFENRRFLHGTRMKTTASPAGILKSHRYGDKWSGPQVRFNLTVEQEQRANLPYREAYKDLKEAIRQKRLLRRMRVAEMEEASGFFYEDDMDIDTSEGLEYPTRETFREIQPPPPEEPRTVLVEAGGSAKKESGILARDKNRSGEENDLYYSEVGDSLGEFNLNLSRAWRRCRMKKSAVHT